MQPPHQNIDQILAILSAIREDGEKLARILKFLEEEIVPALEEEQDEIKIPEKYEALVTDIAQELSSKMICHLNMDTLETESYPQEYEHFYGEEGDEDEDDEIELSTQKHLGWNNLLTFEPLESHESFEIMDDFARQVTEIREQKVLLDILSKSKPFANFNRYIHGSRLREDWFAFRDAAYERHVRMMIYQALQ